MKPQTVGDMYAAERTQLHQAEAAQDWAKVEELARRLRHTATILERFSSEADWTMAMIGRKVIR